MTSGFLQLESTLFSNHTLLSFFPHHNILQKNKIYVYVCIPWALITKKLQHVF
jgi:hypothetical protein